MGAIRDWATPENLQPEPAAADYVALHPGSRLDVSNDFDVVLGRKTS